MKILFTTSACSKAGEIELTKRRFKQVINSSQNFFRMLTEGIAACEEVEITCATARAASTSNSKKRLWRAYDETTPEGVYFHYLPFINGKLTRIISFWLSSFFYTLKWMWKNRKEERCVITDVTIWPTAIPASRVARMCGVKTVSYITDLPEYANINSKKKSGFRRWLGRRSVKKNMRSISKSDGYIYVAPEMARVVNLKNKPQIVVECCVEGNEETLINTPNTRRVFLYAGGVYRKYGVASLVEAFRSSGIDAELRIYGNGDLVDYLVNECNDENIKYCGCVSVSEIPGIERNADFLINPRPTNEDYTRYSFPIKTAEYLSSYRPVLSTRLKGIGKDYEPYILWIEDYTEEKIADALKKAMEMTDEEIIAFGKSSGDFIHKEKNKYVQGQRICDFIRSL